MQFNNGTGVTLNRVNGADLSQIDGFLGATGSVYLVNENGIVIGDSGVVQTGGSFVASSMDVSDEDFLNGGDLRFASNGQAQVLNFGQVGSLGGNVALIAFQSENHGTLSAPNGVAALVAGYDVLMRDTSLNEGMFSVLVGSSDSYVLESGNIAAANAELIANGGNVYALAGNTNGTISATGVASQGGRVFLTGGNVQVTKTVRARTSNGNGGLVKVRADVIDFSGMIDVSGESGGLVELFAKSDVMASGEVMAYGTAADGFGGQIAMTADRVHLQYSSALDASGPAGGGQINVGGAFQGGPGIEAAGRVLIDDGATLSASATGDHGDGGTIIVWSDEITGYYGQIEARGGALSGDGGFAEVSGKQHLAFSGEVDLSAPGGQNGTLLLDPENIIISVFDGTDSGQVADSFVFFNEVPGATFNITPGAIEAVAGTVALEATNDIFVQSVINLSGDSLELYAGNDIHLEAPILNALNLTLVADADFSLLSGGPSDGNGTILFSGGDLLASGIVTLEAGEALALGNINANVLDVTTSNDPITQIGALTIGSVVRLDAGSANITLDNPGNNLGFNVDASGANITLHDIGLLVLGDIDASGNFTASSGGLITDDSPSGAGSDINVTGTTTLTAVTDITLDDPNNDFQGAVSATAVHAIFNDANALTFGDVDLTGSLLVAALGGSITDNGDGVSLGDDINVAGLASFSAPAGDVELNDWSNDFNLFAAESVNDISIVDVNEIFLSSVIAGGNLNVVAAGAISDEFPLTAGAPIIIAGTTTLSAWDGAATYFDILLNNPLNDFAGLVTASGGDISISDANDVLFTTVAAHSNTDTTINTQTGAIILSAGATMDLGEVTGTTPVTGTTGSITSTDGDITLTSGTDMRLLADVTTANGQLSAMSGGAMLVESSASIEGNRVALTATGDFTQATVVGASMTIIGDGNAVGDGIYISGANVDIYGTVDALGSGGVIQITATTGDVFVGEQPAGPVPLLPGFAHFSAPGSVGVLSGTGTMLITATNDIHFDAASTVTFGASTSFEAGNDITLDTALIYDLPNSLTMLAGNNINLNAPVQNSNATGGDVNLVAGWDGTTGAGGTFSDAAFDADPLATATLFGAGTGAVIIGDGTQTTGIAVGSRTGATRVYAHDLTLSGSATTNDAFAQLGFQVSDQGPDYFVTGDIALRLTGGITATGGDRPNTYVQVGHTGADLGTNATTEAFVDAAIEIEALGDLVFTGGSTIFTVAQLGHGGEDTDGDQTGAITIHSARNLIFTGGSGINAGAQLGHGGLGAGGFYGGTITITSANDLIFTGGAGDGSWAQIGHGGDNSGGSFIGDIIIVSANDLVFTGGTGSFSLAQLGHGGLDSRGSADGDIIITSAGDLIFTGGQGDSSNAQLGHEVRNASGDITLSAVADLTFTGGDGDSSDAQFGHQAVRIDGDIAVTSANNLTFSGGLGEYSYAHLGQRGEQFTDSDIFLGTVANLTFSGGTGLVAFAQLGHVNDSFMSADAGTGTITINSAIDLTFTGGAGDDAYAQLGHGGFSLTNDLSGNIHIVSANNLTFTAGSGLYSYAQLGHGGANIQGDMTGDITLTSVNLITFTSGTGFGAYAQLGNGGVDDLVFTGNTHIGDITIASAADIVFTAGPSTAGDAQLGHHSFTIAEGNINIGTAGNLTFAGAQLGHVALTSTAQGVIDIGSVGDLTFLAQGLTAAQLGHNGTSVIDSAISLSSAGELSFSGAQLGHQGFFNAAGDITILSAGDLVFTGGVNPSTVSFAQLGHGGQGIDGDLTGDIAIGTVGDIRFSGDSSNGSSAQLGHGAFNRDVNASGDITISSANDIVFAAGTAAFESYAQLGHGGLGGSGDLNGAIDVTATSLSLMGGPGQGSYAMVGHGAANTGGIVVSEGTRSGDVNLALAGELSIENGPTPGSDQNFAWLGHITVDAGGISNADVSVQATGIDMDADAGLAPGADGALSVAILNNALSGGNVMVNATDSGLTLVQELSAPGGDGVAQANGNDLTLQTSHDVTLGTGVTLTNTGTGNIVLAAGQNFHNDSGTLMPIVTGAGQWAVYSTRPDLNRNDIEIANADFLLYGLSFNPADPMPAGLPAGNGLVYAVTPDVTVTASDVTATYGDAIVLPQTGVTVQVAGTNVDATAFGFTTAETSVDLSAAVLASLSTGGFINAGTYAEGIEVSAQFVAGGVTGQSLTLANADLIIDPRVLSVTATGQDKTYDGTTLASVIFGDDQLAGDALSVSGTATFGDPNVGTDKTVTVTGITLAGGDAGNYTVNTTAATTADITPLTLTVVLADQAKPYDGLGYTLPPIFTGFLPGEDAALVDQSGVMIVGDFTLPGASIVSATGFGAQNYVFDTSDTALLIIFDTGSTPIDSSPTIEQNPVPPPPGPSGSGVFCLQLEECFDLSALQ